ncbi:MAG: tRNA pseudouridine(13) synthase TruD [Fuerstiella sp.]
MNIDELLTQIIDPPRALSPVLPSAVIRAEPEDFQVEEIPTYQPCGTGEHLFLWIEKRDVPAGDLVTRLARGLQISPRDIGVAGQKDRRAITRQYVSVPRSCDNNLSQWNDPEIRVLSVNAHGNKLKTGHLRGNRFRILLRPPDTHAFSEDELTQVSARLKQLEQTGMPNYFGPQRFGHHGSSVRAGLAQLQDEPPASGKSRSRNARLNRFVASALQSAVFNLVLSKRVAGESFSRPGSGDVVCRRDGIRPFLFDQRGETDADCLVPMGPLPGPKMVRATGTVLEAESAALQQLDLTEQHFARSAKLTPGARRRLAEFPLHVETAPDSSGGIVITFELPSGSFATVMLAEVCGSLQSVTGRDADQSS